ncbi:hypothetical protein GW17_00061421, partial [Ensete ventricosum]
KPSPATAACLSFSLLCFLQRPIPSSSTLAACQSQPTPFPLSLPSRVDSAPINCQQPLLLPPLPLPSPTAAILLLPQSLAIIVTPSRAISLCSSRCPYLPPLPSSSSIAASPATPLHRCPLSQHYASPATVIAMQPHHCSWPQPSPLPTVVVHPLSTPPPAATDYHCPFPSPSHYFLL